MLVLPLLALQRWCHKGVTVALFGWVSFALNHSDRRGGGVILVGRESEFGLVFLEYSVHVVV